MDHPAPPAPPAPTTRHARTLLPAEVHARLGHLALDLGCSLADLLVEGAILTCRYHDRGEGLPAPMPPLGKPEPDVAVDPPGGGR